MKYRFDVDRGLHFETQGNDDIRGQMFDLEMVSEEDESIKTGNAKNSRQRVNGPREALTNTYNKVKYFKSHRSEGRNRASKTVSGNSEINLKNDKNIMKNI